MNPNQSPLVSWLMCTNTSGPLLFRALDSCLKQSFEDFEVVLVINGDIRNEIYDEVLAHYSCEPRLRLFRSNVRLLNHSLNYGLDKANGQFISRLDSDDVAYPERLAKQVDFLLSNPEVDVLGSAFDLIDSGGQKHGAVSLPASHESIIKKLRYKNILAHPTVIYRKDRITEIGGYLGGESAEDYDLWLRCLQENFRFSNMSETLTGYNQDPNKPARRSRKAYAGAASSLLRSAIVSGDFRFLIGCFLYCLRAIALTKKA